MTAADLAQGSLYPPLAQVRDVSLQIAVAVADVAFRQGHAGIDRPADLLRMCARACTTRRIRATHEAGDDRVLPAMPLTWRKPARSSSLGSIGGHEKEYRCCRSGSTAAAARASSRRPRCSRSPLSTQGRHAQAFPSFGSERTGAPVVAFCRIDDREIRLREPILAPDALIIQDPTLLHQVDVFQGLAPDGYVLINSTRSFDELGLGEFAQRFRHERLFTVPATEIALKHVGRPLPNAALLGGFAALTGSITLDVGRRTRSATSSPARSPTATSPRRSEAYATFVATSSRSSPHA